MLAERRGGRQTRRLNWFPAVLWVASTWARTARWRMSRRLLVAVMLGGMAHSMAAPPRTERLIALARLDAAMHYFDPAVATRASRWDSLFAADVECIADASDGRAYEQLITAMMRALPAHVMDLRFAGSPHRALVYDGFPNAIMQSSGGYGLRWRGARSGEDVPRRHGRGRSRRRTDIRGLTAIRRTRWLRARCRRARSGARHIRPPDIAFSPPRASGVRLNSSIHTSGSSARTGPRIRAALPPFERARDSLEYALAVAAFAAHINDTHVTVASPTGARSWAPYPSAPPHASSRTSSSSRGSPTPREPAGCEPETSSSVDGEQIDDASRA